MGGLITAPQVPWGDMVDPNGDCVDSGSQRQKNLVLRAQHLGWPAMNKPVPFLWA